MDDYRKQIDRLISRADGEVLLNGSASHAAMVVERMLARAQDSVRIMTRNLDPLIYCDHITKRAAYDFLRSGKALKILVDDLNDGAGDPHPYFVDMAHFENLEIRQVPVALRDSITINFSIMDEKGFRLEKDESGESAIVAFGIEETTTRLNALFETVWRQSSAVKLAA